MEHAKTMRTMFARIGVLLVVTQASLASAQSSSGNCSSGSHAVIAPFLGEWAEYTVTESAEVYIGTLTTRLDTDGCVLSQTFASPDSGFSYRSHGYVNTANLWEETYAFNSGSYSTYLWIVEGETLYTLRIDGSRKSDSVDRLKYIDVKADEYTVVQQESRDGGRTWESIETTRIKRLK